MLTQLHCNNQPCCAWLGVKISWFSHLCPLTCSRGCTAGVGPAAPGRTPGRARGGAARRSAPLPGAGRRGGGPAAGGDAPSGAGRRPEGGELLGMSTRLMRDWAGVRLREHVKAWQGTSCNLRAALSRPRALHQKQGAALKEVSLERGCLSCRERGRSNALYSASMPTKLPRQGDCIKDGPLSS